MESQYRETGIIQVALDDGTRYLIENLHLRRGYALLYVDKYIGDDNQPVSVIYGSHKRNDEEIYGFRVELIIERKMLFAEVNLWKISYDGWPMVNVDGKHNFFTPVTKANENAMREIAKELLLYCEKPHEQASGVPGMLRSLFDTVVGNRRKYKR